MKIARSVEIWPRLLSYSKRSKEAINSLSTSSEMLEIDIRSSWFCVSFELAGQLTITHENDGALWGGQDQVSRRHLILVLVPTRGVGCSPLLRLPRPRRIQIDRLRGGAALTLELETDSESSGDHFNLVACPCSPGVSSRRALN